MNVDQQLTGASPEPPRGQTDVLSPDGWLLAAVPSDTCHVLEQQHRDKAREQLIQSERKAHAVRNELEEAKTQLENADRQRRGAEQDLSDVMEQLADSTLQNQNLQTSKRKLDSEMQTIKVKEDACSN